MEHDEPEKMVEVKKAYAEIILNTAKEAAARVMAAERRAVRFEHDLRATKDDALQMMLRLKQMIDFKTNEAHMTSLKRDRKIEELEAQLFEAEDIITDLRSELKQAWGELERVSPDQVQPLNGETDDTSFSGNLTPEPMTLSCSGLGHEDALSSDLKNTSVFKGLDHKVSNGLEQTEQQLSGNTTREDASFSGNVTPEPMTLSPSGLRHEDAPNSGLKKTSVSRSPDPKASNRLAQTEQQLSGETTREDASFSGNVTPEPMTLSPSGARPEDAPNSGLKNTSVSRSPDYKVSNGLEQTEQHLSVSDSDKFCAPVCDFDSIIMRSKEPELLRNGCTQRVRAFESNSFNVKLPLPGYEDNHKSQRKNELNELIVKESDNGIDLVKQPSSKETKTLVKVRTIRRKKTQFGEAKTSQLCRPNQLMSSCQPSSTSGKDGSHNDACIQPSPVLSRCKTFAYLINGDVKSCEDQPNTAEKTEAKMKPLPRLDPGRTLIRRGVDPISGSTSVKVSIKGISSSGPVQNDADKGSKLIDVSVSIKPGKDVMENSEAPSTELSLGTSAVLGMNTELTDVKVSEQSSESPSHVDNRGLRKDTSQRKRKDFSGNPDETASFEENTTKRRAEERESITPQLQNESSRDSRRLAQVARQLISLSGKRW
ncbi:uncharacterized protein LOC126798724 [Argentina anserina]|uniref:uncharacterized protein LOC126798724 n=1 Tax=Argentina anserina TaxID=57926 RepID=UPI0021767156|nr:uncharacterized protein LOC126798724 [Potentilla anserina]